MLINIFPIVAPRGAEGLGHLFCLVYPDAEHFISGQCHSLLQRVMQSTQSRYMYSTHEVCTLHYNHMDITLFQTNCIAQLDTNIATVWGEPSCGWIIDPAPHRAIKS